MALRHLLALAALVTVLVSACGQRPTAVLGQQMSGCVEALRERAAAVAEVDAAEKRALERSRARAVELQAIASEAKGQVVAAADLRACEGPDERSGIAADLSDLRARYSVIVDRAIARLDETAARPVEQRANDRGKGKGKD